MCDQHCPLKFRWSLGKCIPRCLQGGPGALLALPSVPSRPLRPQGASWPGGWGKVSTPVHTEDLGLTGETAGVELEGDTHSPGYLLSAYSIARRGQGWSDFQPTRTHYALGPGVRGVAAASGAVSLVQQPQRLSALLTVPSLPALPVSPPIAITALLCPPFRGVLPAW